MSTAYWAVLAVLFPPVIIDPNEKIRTVDLVEYDPNWSQLFSREAQQIKPISCLMDLWISVRKKQ